MPRIAIVGRPNAGKSSLVNRLLGQERQIVDDRPGTTIDSVDTLYDKDGAPLVLIDTAGIRRKRAVEQGLEAMAVMQAIRAVERSHTVVLMIDAKEGASQQDARIAGMALDRGRAICIGLNKIDLLDARAREAAVKHAQDEFAFMPWVPLIRLSAKSGQGVQALMKKVRQVTAAHHKRVPTAEVNRFFEEVLAHHPPPTSGGRSVRLYYVTQARTRTADVHDLDQLPRPRAHELPALRHEPAPRALRLRGHPDPHALPPTQARRVKARSCLCAVSTLRRSRFGEWQGHEARAAASGHALSGFVLRDQPVERRLVEAHQQVAVKIDHRHAARILPGGVRLSAASRPRPRSLFRCPSPRTRRCASVARPRRSCRRRTMKLCRW